MPMFARMGGRGVFLRSNVGENSNVDHLLFHLIFFLTLDRREQYRYLKLNRLKGMRVPQCSSANA